MTDSRSPEQPLVTPRRSALWDACAYCAQRYHLRRTVRIAIVVGIILTLINQGAVIAIVVGIILTLINQGAVIIEGDATAATWVRCALNFIVPFLVSNAGLLSARR